MKKNFSIIFSIAIIFSTVACHQKPAEENKSATETKKDSVVFYPVNDFLKKEIRLVDSTPFYIYKITVRNGTRDSSKVSKKEFDSLALMFVKNDISEASIKKNYKESVFDDASTDSYTFDYATHDSTMFVQSIDILLNKDKQAVKHVFMNIFENFKDSIVASKMGWKPGRNFYINRIVDLPNGKEITEQNMIVWDERE